MKRFSWENDILTTLHRYRLNGAALYEPFEEPFENDGSLPSAKQIRPLLFKMLRSRFENSKASWVKGNLKLEEAQEREFWRIIGLLQEKVSTNLPDFPIEPDQNSSAENSSLQKLVCASEHIVITLIVYSTLDFEIEKLFSSVRNRLDVVLGRGEKSSESVHHVESWFRQLAEMEQLGIFNNLTKPSAPYWLSANNSFLESLDYHKNQLREFKKAVWPDRQLHRAYAAEKTNKEKLYRAWSIAGLVEVLKNSGYSEKYAVQQVRSVYEKIGLDVNIQNFISRQKKAKWKLPDPTIVWNQLSASLLVTNLTPEIGKKSRITAA